MQMHVCVDCILLSWCYECVDGVEHGGCIRGFLSNHIFVGQEREDLRIISGVCM